jgi:catechol 2,3-dioxygenase-like lactoylglutathione lyase family enzyme
MSRVQLALRVADLEESIKFYSNLFEAEPAKLRPGYANFAIAEPPLKLVLTESRRSSMSGRGVITSSDGGEEVGIDRAGEGLPLRDR